MPSAPVKVTVLMTLYNKGPYVAEAIHSILNNSFTNLELLVVDDASTDGGLEVVKAITDPRIRILESQVNTGRAAAANRGYDAARGEYVAVLDADDIAHPERLAKQVAFLDSQPEVGVVGSYYQTKGPVTHIGRLPVTDAACRAPMLFTDPVLYGSAMFRRSVLEAHGLRCNAEWRLPGMDYLFMLSIAPHAAYANLPEALITYRLGDNNMRHGRNPLADKAQLNKEVFRLFGLQITDREVQLQMALHDVYDLRFTPTSVRELRTWMERLIKMNREHGVLPLDLFEAELERRWSHVYHPIADTGLGAALTHLRLSRSWPRDRLAYLMKTTVNRWLGRSRTQQ